MSKVSNENFIVIQGWMVNELELKGNELLVYAIIYGFSQTEGTKFTGSINYLCDFTNSSRTTIIKCLKTLTDKKLIIKNQKNINGVVFNEYQANLCIVKNLNLGSQETKQGGVNNLNGGSQESVPNNKDNNKSNNKKNNKKETYVSILDSYTTNEELKESLQSFIEMRKKMKGFTVNAFKLNLKKLDKLAIDDYTKTEIVNQSVMNSWKGFFELSNKSNKNGLDQLPF